jgi:hypothetical protein
MFLLYAVWHRYKINFQHTMNSVEHIYFQKPCYSLADFSSIMNFISSHGAANIQYSCAIETFLLVVVFPQQRR